MAVSQKYIAKETRKSMLVGYVIGEETWVHGLGFFLTPIFQT